MACLKNRTKANMAGALRMRGKGGRGELSWVWKAGRNGEDQITEGLLGQGREV